jgi:hypothetical protein
MDRVGIISREVSPNTWSLPPNSAVPTTGKKSKKALLGEYLREKRLAAVRAHDWKELFQRLEPISESYLRRLLRDTGVPVEAPYGGVSQKTFEELEQSLAEMEQVYSAARDSGDQAQAQYARNAVIEAKEHARFAARHSKTSPEKRAEKEEMIQWMLVWLDNPGVFPAWVKLRKQKM